jgi:hypothetical protein
MSNRLALSIATLAAALWTSAADAQTARGDRWVRIGTQHVDLARETSTIDLSKSKGKVKAVRLQAARGDIELSRVQVVYGKDDVHNEDRRINLLVGERTRPIDPAGTERFVDQINLVYKPSQGKKALLEVWALQSPAGAKAVRPPAAAAPVTGQIPAAATPAVPSKAAPGEAVGGEVLLGVQHVGFGVDRDLIRVGNEIGKFDKIRLRVLDNDIHINELKVVYGDGQSDTAALDADVKANSRTGWFTLRGDRFIREIQMSYRSRPSFKGQARIEVFGDLAEGWLGVQGEGRRFNQGWVLLGAQTAGFIGFDRDIIPVGRNEGGFKKVRLTVQERAITLDELRVVYGNGKEDVIPVKARVDAGTTWGPVDLTGGTRAIKEVQARYRSRFFDKGAKGASMAIVQVWGQH